MPSAGSLWIDGERIEVTGESWMDHEWGTSFLEPGQVGWDWFSIQLEDGSELMLFQIRRNDGAADPFASGTLVDAAGRATRLGAGDFVLRPGTTWTSPDSGARYPVAWTVSVPPIGLDAEVRAAFPEQELTDRVVWCRDVLGGSHRRVGDGARAPGQGTRLPRDDGLHGTADERGVEVGPQPRWLAGPR